MRQVIIEQLNIHMPDNWQGDAVLLARSVANQIQKQAGELTSSKTLTIHLDGQFSGMIQLMNKQLSVELIKQNGLKD